MFSLSSFNVLGTRVIERLFRMILSKRVTYLLYNAVCCTTTATLGMLQIVPKYYI